ncbi:unnamed protein product [Ceutorhynchus assimilis]|uniref:Uncharacterized protein n=1 Tax=Ceutorhynchus assimilis TaxID=467358 RepID=A0A9N9QIM5_9CUCU|nr:unnamed protein product [Ceutorhynchus assimilis]
MQLLTLASLNNGKFQSRYEPKAEQENEYKIPHKESLPRFSFEVGGWKSLQPLKATSIFDFRVDCACGSIVCVKGFCIALQLNIILINNTEIVTSLLSRGASVDVKGESYYFESSMTPLHICASKAKKNFNIHIAKDLLNYDGASINSLTSKGYTPLYFASKRGIVEAVKLFLDWGADINASTKDNLSPLHVAIENGHKTVIKLLLECGAIVYNQDTDRSVLHFAVEIGSLLIVEEVLKYCPDVNNANFSFNNKEPDSNVKGEIAKLLLSKGAHVDVQTEYGKTTLLSSTKKGYAKVVEVLLEYNANVNLALKSGFTPLHISAQDGNLEISTMILNKGANVNAAGKNGITALHLAAKNGHAGVVKLLLECNAKFDSEFQFHNAPLLLECGAAVDNQDTDRSVLQLAVGIGSLLIVEEVLKYCPDINNATNRNSLEIAVRGCRGKGQKKQEEIAKLLISYGAKLNTQDETGKTPIFYATKNADLKMIELLLTNGAIVEDDPELLYIALRKEYKEIVEALLQHDADINACDNYGRTALHFTASDQHEYFRVRDYFPSLCSDNFSVFSFNNKEPDSNIKGEIAKLLLSKGAHVDVQTKYVKTTLLSSTKK